MAASEEVSLLEYARFQGLTKDHRQLNPLDHLPKAKDFEQELANPLDTVNLEDRTGIDLREHIRVDQCTASLLDVCTRPPVTPPPLAIDALESRRRDRKNLYIELPLLNTDHESDLEKFTQRQPSDLAQECRSLPLEDINDEADEGLEWPRKYQTLPVQIMDAIATEKLVDDGQVLKFLSTTLRSATSGEKDTAAFEWSGEQKEFNIWQRSDEMEILSPFLMPTSPNTPPDVPLSNPDPLVSLSDQTKSSSNETRCATEEGIRDDRVVSNSPCHGSSSQIPEHLVQATESIGNVGNPDNLIKAVPSSLVAARSHAEGCKADVSLSLQSSDTFDATEPKRTGGTSSTSPLTKTALRVPDCGLTREDVDSILEGIAEPHDIVAEKLNQQGTLATLVPSLKITVPVMDFPKPIAVWETMTSPLDQIKHAQLNTTDNPEATQKWNIPEWPLSREIERSLRWNPFLISSGQIDLHEMIVDHDAVNEYIKQPDCVDIDALLCKKEGLRIFDELEEAVEEIEESSFPIGCDTMSLIRKRKLDLDGEMSQQDTTSKHIPKENLQYSRNPDTFFSQGTLHISPGSLNSERHSIQGTESNRMFTMNSLESFMTTRGCLLQENDERQDKSDKTLPPKLHSRVPKMHVANRSTSGVRDDNISQFKHPTVSIPTGHRAFIVSEAFLSDRKLARRVQCSWPSAEMFARDSQWLGSKFNVEETATRMSNSSNESGLHRDADVIFSPSTGLIYTTLQQIRQRPLPGHQSYTAVQTRVMHIAAQFERLIVLISQDEAGAGMSESRSVAPRLTGNDCNALDQFNNFISKLEDDILTTFVYGGKEELADCTIARMAEYSIPNTEQVLSQEETPQERFLRKAGMNAFAAQTILAAVHQAPTRPDNGQLNESYLGSRDLAKFLHMSSEDRLNFFESVLGGTKLLQRVNRWLGALDGGNHDLFSA